jgi:hypothetical protein
VRVVALTLIAAALFGACGGDDNPTPADETAARTESRRTEIELMVRNGKLPPIAGRLIAADGSMNLDFIDGPEYANDVVRTSPDGMTGKKLQWDLNRNGRIDRSERTITEQELYAATAP